MYGKIFESMYEGSLYGQWEAIVTFQQMIVIADQYGVVDMTPQAIAGKTSIPLEIIEKGIELLSQPDGMSRTPGNNGVRITLLDEHRAWGWEIVNYAQYRDKSKREDRRKQNRDNKRAERKRERRQAESRDANPDELKRGDPPRKRKPQRDPKPKRFAEFWEAYPKKRNPDRAEAVWRDNNLDELADTIIADVKNREANDPEWQRDEQRYVPHPNRYLKERRWLDEFESTGKAEKKPLACNTYLAVTDSCHVWIPDDLLAHATDLERSEYETVKAVNLKNGYAEPDWNSPAVREKVKAHMESIDNANLRNT